MKTNASGYFKDILNELFDIFEKCAYSLYCSVSNKKLATLSYLFTIGFHPLAGYISTGKLAKHC